MGRLFVFGDSFSDREWPKILSTLTGIPIVVCARGGCTNQDILDSIIANIQLLEEGDKISIQISGQNRLNVKDVVVYNNRWETQDWMLELSEREREAARKWFDYIHLPTVATFDRNVNSIITLANFLSLKFKVVLWNLLPIVDIASIPDTDLWHPLSNNGNVGWADIIREKELHISETDFHPTLEGHEFIANEMIKAIINTEKSCI
jgi:hypothetical protein